MKRNRNNWLDCIYNYRFHSIFFRNLTLIVCVIILPFICVLGISYYSYKHIYNSEEKAYTDEVKTMIIKDVENLFYEFREKALLLSSDTDVNIFFYLTGKEDDDHHYDWNVIQNYIRMYRLSTDVLDDVYIYAPQRQVICSSVGRVNYDSFHDKECIDRWENTIGMYQYEYLSRIMLRMRKENVSLYYTMQYGVGNAGVIIFQLNMDKLRKIFDYGDSINLIIIGNDQVLFDSTRQWIGQKVENTEEIEKGMREGILISHELQDYGLNLLLHMDREVLDTRLDQIKLFLVIFTIFMLCIVLILAFYISKKIYDPFTEILKVLEHSSNDKENLIFQNRDEISHIMNSISMTISRNKNVEAELTERIRLLKKAQTVALQAQINPHFINNTLETINWMAVEKLGDNNDISQMLDELSLLMRKSLEDSDTFVTLKEELVYVKNYLFIQQKRFKNRFDVKWNISAELEECKVIKLILQPIVENAINYGIKPYGNKGRIKIEAFRKDDIICITVTDSGMGITEQEVKDINHSIRKKVIKESSHIGLSNVHQRIILAFGEKYGVTVKSRMNEGTEVLLELPYQM